MNNVKIPPPCFRFLNGEIVEVKEGLAVIKFVTTEEMENPYGSTQGGILAGMIDNSLGPAIFALSPQRKFATTQMNINFLKPVKTGDKLIVTSVVLKSGKKQAYMEATIKREEDGELMAKASAINLFLD